MIFLLVCLTSVNAVLSVRTIGGINVTYSGAGSRPLRWEATESGYYCDRSTRVVLDDVDSVEDCFQKAMSHFNCGTRPYQIYTDVLARKAEYATHKGKCRCVKADGCRVKQAFHSAGLVFYKLKGANEDASDHCSKADGAPCSWMMVDRDGALCNDNTRVKLSEKVTGVEECGDLAFESSECESKPYQIYLDGSGKCRCVKKGKPCVEKKSVWNKKSVFYEFSVRHPRPVDEIHDLVLLVTRHGLSCANVIDKWGSALTKYWHVNMEDPLLATAGEVTTRQAKLPVMKWLANRSLAVDAVMSSVLARAAQTATIQYPDSNPVYMVPYLRESGKGKDNVAKEYSTYVGRLEDIHAVSPAFVPGKAEREAPGDWGKFRQFLEETFLPTRFPTLAARGVAKPYVFGVVTHSNFMKEGEVKAKCGHLYPRDSNGKSKTNNNQVVAIPYKLHTSTTISVAGEIIGVKYRLLEGGECENVADGTELPYMDGTSKLKNLCMKDIGDDCLRHLEEAAYVPETVEAEIVKVRKKLEDDAADVKELKRLASTALSRDARFAHPFLLADAMDRKRLTETDLAQLESSQCWVGGKPEPDRLAGQSNLRALHLTIEQKAAESALRRSETPST